MDLRMAVDMVSRASVIDISLRKVFSSEGLLIKC